MPKDLVFLSYSRKDQAWAERLYMDLRRLELPAWLDIRCLPAGAEWDKEIRRAIRSARYFVPLISQNSVDARSFVHEEVKEALACLEPNSRGDVFIIPVRLDHTAPMDTLLAELNWIQLLPDYHQGFSRLLTALSDVANEPLTRAQWPGGLALQSAFIDKGKEVSLDVPLLLGPRAAVSYAPFRTRNDFLQQFFDRLPKTAMFADLGFSYYVTFDTNCAGVELSEALLKRYPGSMTIILQLSFDELVVYERGLSVTLRFDGEAERVAVPFMAISSIWMPEIGTGISFDVKANES